MEWIENNAVWIRAAISSKDFEGKKGQRLSVWTEGCRVLLVGMGKRKRLQEN